MKKKENNKLGFTNLSIINNVKIFQNKQNTYIVLELAEQ